jgi:hypothetical protein
MPLGIQSLYPNSYPCCLGRVWIISNKEWIWGGYQRVIPITPIPTLNMRDGDGEVDPWGQGGRDSNREKDGADEHGVGIS